MPKFWFAYISMISMCSLSPTLLTIGFQAWAPDWTLGPATAILRDVAPGDVVILPVVKGQDPSDVFEPGDVAFFSLSLDVGYNGAIQIQR